jgi:VanZ family protein
MLLPPKERLLLPTLWFLTITWLSTKGGISIPGFRLIATDKLGHAAAYALFAFLLVMAYNPMNNAKLRNIWLFCFVYGAFMEFIQYAFFPNRFFEFDDMLANGIGAAIVVGWYFFKNKK